MPAIIHDVFPSEVVVSSPNPDTGEMVSSFEILSARVVVTDNEVLVAVDSPTGPVMVLRLPYTPGNFEKGAKLYDRSSVLASTGQRLTFRRDDSCGCGSRLRGWNPYATIVASNA